MASFSNSATLGTTFEAGFFLVDDEQCLRETALISANHAQKVARGQRTIVPMGAVVPANDGTAVGILYEDIDVTDGDALGSIVTKGTIYGDRLPATLASAAASALAGITVKTAPAVVRPAAFAKFATLSVASADGATTGTTKLTVTGYVPKVGESFVYSTDATTAPSATLGTDVSAWTTWNGTSDVTATTGHKITVAVKDGDGKAIAAGSATVTSKS